MHAKTRRPPTPVPPFQSESTRSAIRPLIAAQILDGRLPPGDKLSPAALASELGVSATPLREALIELARDGYLDNRSQYGFVVRPLRSREIEELYRIIAALECFALRQQTFGQDALGQLDGIDDVIANPRRRPDLKALSGLDALWHSTLVSGSNNETLEEMLEILRSRAQRYEEAYARHSDAVLTSAKRHRAVTRALKKGDVDAAAKALEDNWLARIKVLVTWLEALPPRDQGITLV